MKLYPWVTHCFLFFFLLIPSLAEAFIFLRGSGYLKGERPVSAAPTWSSRSVTFYVNTNLGTMGGSLTSSVTSAEFLQSAQAAVNAWADACRADLHVTLLGTTSGTYHSSDGINIIQWDNRTTGEGNYYGTSTATLASATTVLSGTEFQDCDIILNGNSSTTMAFSPSAGEADLRSVLTHEIGHCLGLDHPIEPPDYTSVDPFLTEATMVQTAATGLDPSDTGRRSIAQDDRDAIECIYERGKPLRSGIHCGSYSGTNSQGALSGAVVGGPSVTDTVCGGDAQGRNTNPSLESGDGCIPSAIAGTHKKNPSTPLLRLGGSFGFFLAIFFLFLFRSYRRPLFLFFVFFSVSSVSAYDLEMKAIVHAIDPTAWNAFGGMDPEATAWERAPTTEKLGALTEIRATYFQEPEEWGKWGASLTLTLPTSIETNGKATSAADQRKKTTLSGFRIGPEARYYLLPEENRARWFVGGHFDLGILLGTQTFSNGYESSLSYRAWTTEFALKTGVEIPIQNAAFIAEIGYARLHSSYFASTGNSGSGYSDFPSGTRLSSNTGGGREDLRFSGNGIYAALGLQISFGTRARISESKEETPIYPIPAPTSSAPPPPWEIDPIPSEGHLNKSDFLSPALSPPPNEADPVPVLEPKAQETP